MGRDDNTEVIQSLSKYGEWHIGISFNLIEPQVTQIHTRECARPHAQHTHALTHALTHTHTHIYQVLQRCIGSVGTVHPIIAQIHEHVSL